MQRLLGLFACLLLVLSLGMGSVAHATETVTCIEASEGGLHTPGDADEVPADSEKGYPHHHGGCHGHHVASPLDDTAPQISRTYRDRPFARSEASLASIGLDAALRPPRA